MALATLERTSDSVPVMDSCGFATVALFAGEVMANTGGVLSILSVTDADAMFPPLSVAVREMTWLAPSLEAITG